MINGKMSYNKTKHVRVPKELIDKGETISELTGLPRTKAFGIFSEGISMPNKIEVKKVPRSKKKKVIATWTREWEVQ